MTAAAAQPAAGATGTERTTLRLRFERPYPWRELLAYYRDRAIAGVEVVGRAYVRSIRIGGSIACVSIACDAARAELRAELASACAADRAAVEQRLRAMLDLDASPAAIAEHLGRDPLLRDVVAAYPGLRIPGCWDVFECVVRAIVGQQVSVKAARTVLGRLALAYGERLAGSAGATAPSHAFPTPAALADRDLTGVGLNAGRADALAAVARSFAEDPEFVHPEMPAADAYATLLGVRGIGPWTASYVLLRGLREPDAFPAGDLGARKASGARNAAEIGRWAERWRPWRGYALLYLWKSLSEEWRDGSRLTR